MSANKNLDFTGKVAVVTGWFQHDLDERTPFFGFSASPAGDDRIPSELEIDSW